MGIFDFTSDYTARVFMTLLALVIRCKDDRDVMLIGDVALLNCDHYYSWMNLILRIFHSYS